jgi:hypothetical protein
LQLVCVAVALQVVAYDLQGSAATEGTQAVPATHAAMQAPALHTCPEPHEFPSATLVEVSVQTAVPA